VSKETNVALGETAPKIVIDFVNFENYEKRCLKKLKHSTVSVIQCIVEKIINTRTFSLIELPL
jgi:hypothetical protein